MSVFQIDLRAVCLPLLLLAACSTASSPETTAPTTDVAQEAAQPASNTTSNTTEASPPAAQVISTEAFTPKPIRITLDDLPQPYATESARQGPNIVAVPANPTLQVPPGFQVNVFAEGLESPRWLALTPAGDVLVTETPQNQIRLLQDTDGDGVADQKMVFGDRQNGLNRPFGMAFSSNAFFLGNTDGIVRFPYQPGQTQLEGQGEKIVDLPSNGHWTRNVVISPDQEKLYVAIGSRSNVDSEPLPRASVQELNLDGSEMETFAYGLRNPVGLAFHPVTQDLYVTVNERDGLGDDLVPDYLTEISQGEFYGWPYTYLATDFLDPRRSRDGQSEEPELAGRTKTPDVLFQAHSAALGVDFYDGNTFPERYRNGAFVALRGSWNRSQGTGYKLVFVPFDQSGEPLDYYEDFVTGFLLDANSPTAWGRPVGVLTLPDGSILFTEEANHRIYRVQYVGTENP